MNLRDAQILNARKKAGERGYYCNLITQIHIGCEHGESLLSTEMPKAKKNSRKTRACIASREEQNARYIDCGPSAWDDRD